MVYDEKDLFLSDTKLTMKFFGKAAAAEHAATNSAAGKLVTNETLREGVVEVAKLAAEIALMQETDGAYGGSTRDANDRDKSDTRRTTSNLPHMQDLPEGVISAVNDEPLSKLHQKLFEADPALQHHMRETTTHKMQELGGKEAVRGNEGKQSQLASHIKAEQTKLMQIRTIISRTKFNKKSGPKLEQQKQMFEGLRHEEPQYINKLHKPGRHISARMKLTLIAKGTAMQAQTAASTATQTVYKKAKEHTYDKLSYSNKDNLNKKAATAKRAVKETTSEAYNKLSPENKKRLNKAKLSLQNAAKRVQSAKKLWVKKLLLQYPKQTLEAQ